jgi:proton-translocating NADH-quinone oxidoreductase chain M
VFYLLTNQPIFVILAFLFGAFGLTFLLISSSAEGLNSVRRMILFTSTLALAVGLFSALSFDQAMSGYQFSCNITFNLGVDGLSMVFLLLTLYTFPTFFLAAGSTTHLPKQYYTYLLFMEILLVLTFTVTDLFYFFILFESLLIPMFLIIGIWGARNRKIKAAYYFFLYTLAGSLFMLFGIFYLYYVTGSLNYYELAQSHLDQDQQEVIWFCFFIAFAIKTPLFPFHIWLPEAHVEAPTVGSMLLASLLLKLGSYGFFRFSLTYLSEGAATYTPALVCLSVLGVVYGSMSTIRQIDLKRVVAYSSVAHMNLGVLGVFSENKQGLDGAIFLSVAHGVVSPALFLCVGVVYDLYHTRLIRYYAGLVAVMPLFASLFFYFSLANTAFPGTPGFVGELLTLNGIFFSNPGTVLLGATGIVFSAVYSLLAFNRTTFTTLKARYIQLYRDLKFQEFAILVTLVIAAFVLGLIAAVILNFTDLFTAETLILQTLTSSLASTF